MIGIIPLYIATATGAVVLAGLCVPAGDWDARNINRADNNGNWNYSYHNYRPYQNDNGNGYYLNDYYLNRFNNANGRGYVQERYDENYDQRGRNLVCYGIGLNRRCYDQNNNGYTSDYNRLGDNNDVYYKNNNRPSSSDSYGGDNNGYANNPDPYQSRGEGDRGGNVVCRGFGSYRRCYDEPANTFRYPGNDYRQRTVPSSDYQGDNSDYRGGANGY